MRFKVSCEHHWRLRGDQARSGSAVVQNFEEKCRRYARLGGQHEGFAERMQQVADDKVLRKFGVQAHAGAAAVIEQLSHRLTKPAYWREDSLVSTHHEGQVSALGSVL